MNDSTPSPRVDRPHEKEDADSEKNELRRKLLDLIKRQEMIRREKPR